MGLFKSKAEKDREKKKVVRNSIRELQKRIVALDKKKEHYVETARIAIRENLPEQIGLARQALKMTIAERKRTYKMLLNAEIINQIKDMNNMTKEFLNAVQILSKEIASDSVGNVKKIKNDLAKAMDRTSEITDDIEDLMDDSDDMFDGATIDSDILDREVDAILYGMPSGSAISENQIDEELKKLNAELDQ